MRPRIMQHGATLVIVAVLHVARPASADWVAKSDGITMGVSGTCTGPALLNQITMGHDKKEYGTHIKWSCISNAIQMDFYSNDACSGTPNMMWWYALPDVALKLGCDDVNVTATNGLTVPTEGVAAPTLSQATNEQNTWTLKGATSNEDTTPLGVCTMFGRFKYFCLSEGAYQIEFKITDANTVEDCTGRLAEIMQFPLPSTIAPNAKCVPKASSSTSTSPSPSPEISASSSGPIASSLGALLVMFSM